MLIFELMTSLLLWVSIMIPVNSYLLGVSERTPYKLIQDISNQTIFDGTKVGAEALMNRSDLCDGEIPSSAGADTSAGTTDADTDAGSGTTITGAIMSPTTYTISFKNIPVKSTSTEATGIISDGQNLYVSLNSASTTDYDLVVYNYKNISVPLDKLDTGPGIVGVTVIGKNIFAINSSVNSALQRFKFNLLSSKIEKMGDYKIPWSSSANPVYATKISSIYPYLFVGLKKNSDEELLSVDLNKIDLGLGLASAINRKWELDSSVSAIWPMYDKYLHILVSTAKEPEINDFCLNCDFASTSISFSTSSSSISTPDSTFDLYGSLGNVRSLIASNGSIYVGRTPGNNELFKVNIARDYSSIISSITTPITSSTTNPINTYDLVNSLDVNEGVYSMVISNQDLFLVAGKTNSKIQIRPIDDISKLTQTINTTSTISDLECIGGKIFGVGSNYEMNGTTTKSITPVIFELEPVN